jgi:hypothetical protein
MLCPITFQLLFSLIKASGFINYDDESAESYNCRMYDLILFKRNRIIAEVDASGLGSDRCQFLKQMMINRSPHFVNWIAELNKSIVECSRLNNERLNLKLSSDKLSQEINGLIEERSDLIDHKERLLPLKRNENSGKLISEEFGKFIIEINKKINLIELKTDKFNQMHLLQNRIFELDHSIAQQEFILYGEITSFLNYIPIGNWDKRSISNYVAKYSPFFENIHSYYQLFCTEFDQLLKN